MWVFLPHLFWTSFITRKFVNELSDRHWNTFWGYSRDHWSCSSWTAAEADFMGKRDVTTVWLVSKYDSSTDLWLAVRLMRWTLVWVSQVTFAVEGGYSRIYRCPCKPPLNDYPVITPSYHRPVSFPEDVPVLVQVIGSRRWMTFYAANLSQAGGVRGGVSWLVRNYKLFDWALCPGVCWPRRAVAKAKIIFFIIYLLKLDLLNHNRLTGWWTARQSLDHNYIVYISIKGL